MTKLTSAEAILQYALLQSGITQQESVGGSLYCELMDQDQAESFRKDLQEKVPDNTEVKMYRLGRGVSGHRQEYVYDFVPRVEVIPDEVDTHVQLEAEIARGR